MLSDSEVRVSKTAQELFDSAAREFTRLAAEAVDLRGRFCVALSGGSTPKALYTLLSSGKFSFPWNQTNFFWGDERHVPPDDPQSNYRMAYEAMLSKVPVKPENIFRIHGEEKDAKVAARQYEQTLISFFGLKAGEFPRFDLILLGTGPEGHTASLFPDSAALAEQSRLVVANWVEKFNTLRITLTLPVLNHAAVVVFLASGEDKAEIIQKVLEGRGALLPAQMVHPENGKLIWYLDQAAAGKLSFPQKSAS